MNKDLTRAVAVLGALLALGMTVGAFILGTQLKHIGGGRQTIVVKGLAEKPVKADYAEWTIGARTNGQTFAEALAKLREARPALDEFLKKAGFDKDALSESAESVEPKMVQEETASGRSHEVQKGFDASQQIVATSRDLARVASAHKAAVEFEAAGHPVFYSAPLYLVSNLEEVKMSLIGAATLNAQKRAGEFARNGGVKVGAMRSASQGAFYILRAGANVEAEEYGGSYDKSTVDKTARVVVTIEYNIER